MGSCGETIIIGEIFEEFYQHAEPCKCILSLFLFLVCCNCLKAWLKINKFQLCNSNAQNSLQSTSSPAHLFAKRGRRKRGPGTLHTREQNLPR